MERVQEFLDITLIHFDKHDLKIISILYVILILLAARIIVWAFRKYLGRFQKEGKMDEGKRYAIGQIFAYLIYVIAIVSAIDSLGFKITVLLAGSTALLVGLGLGLQDFFKDLVAGFIILFERAVTAGDIIEVNGTVGKVKEVGLRTTTLLTREDIILIVPNTHLTSNNVINWSQNQKTTRFRIDVGVAYGSDTRLVEKILIKCAAKHKNVISSQEPYVFFKDFGNSSLDFSLYFFSKNLFRIEKTKSDIRFEIDQQFRENNITIPFPQQDVWIKQIPNSSLPTKE